MFGWSHRPVPSPLKVLVRRCQSSWSTARETRPQTSPMRFSRSSTTVRLRQWRRRRRRRRRKRKGWAYCCRRHCSRARAARGIAPRRGSASSLSSRAELVDGATTTTTRVPTAPPLMPERRGGAPWLIVRVSFYFPVYYKKGAKISSLFCVCLTTDEDSARSTGCQHFEHSGNHMVETRKRRPKRQAAVEQSETVEVTPVKKQRSTRNATPQKATRKKAQASPGAAAGAGAAGASTVGLRLRRRRKGRKERGRSGGAPLSARCRVRRRRRRGS